MKLFCTPFNISNTLAGIILLFIWIRNYSKRIRNSSAERWPIPEIYFSLSTEACSGGKARMNTTTAWLLRQTWHEMHFVHAFVNGNLLKASYRLCTRLRGKSVRSWCDGSSDRSFMVDQVSYFSFQPVPHDLCDKGRGMCYPVCGMVHIKEPLLLIGKSSPCGGSGFSLSLSEWSFTICLTPYNRK